MEISKMCGVSEMSFMDESISELIRSNWCRWLCNVPAFNKVLTELSPSLLLHLSTGINGCVCMFVFLLCEWVLRWVTFALSALT